VTRRTVWAGLAVLAAGVAAATKVFAAGAFTLAGACDLVSRRVVRNVRNVRDHLEG
jgi:hypothetical protein